MIVQRLELDLDVAGLHDFIDLSVLLSTDKLAMFIRKLNLEADLVLVDLSERRSQREFRERAEGKAGTLRISWSIKNATALRTSFSVP